MERSNRHEQLLRCCTDGPLVGREDKYLSRFGFIRTEYGEPWHILDLQYLKFLFQFWMTAVANTLPVPCGIFIPVFVAGKMIFLRSKPYFTHSSFQEQPSGGYVEKQWLSHSQLDYELMV